MRTGAGDSPAGTRLGAPNKATVLVLHDVSQLDSFLSLPSQRSAVVPLSSRCINEVLPCTFPGAFASSLHLSPGARTSISQPTMFEPSSPITIYARFTPYPAFLLASDEGQPLSPGSVILRHRHLQQQQRIIKEYVLSL